MNLALAKSAGDFRTNVLLGEPQGFLAMRTRRIRVRLDHRRTLWVQPEVGRAEFALHTLPQILPIDFEFLMATRAVNEQPKGGNFNQAIDLLERNEMRDFDAIFFQLWIQ